MTRGKTSFCVYTNILYARVVIIYYIVYFKGSHYSLRLIFSRFELYKIFNILCARKLRFFTNQEKCDEPARDLIPLLYVIWWAYTS